MDEEFSEIGSKLEPKIEKFNRKLKKMAVMIKNLSQTDVSSLNEDEFTRFDEALSKATQKMAAKPLPSNPSKL